MKEENYYSVCGMENNMGRNFTIFIVICIIGMFIYQSVQYRRTRRKMMQEHLNGLWGMAPDRAYDASKMEQITCYDRIAPKKEATYRIDDITWNDLDLDGVFARTNYTESSAGDEYYYGMLRNPSMNPAKLEERERIVEAFADREFSMDTGEVFYKLGRVYNLSLYDAIDRLEKLKKGSLWIHLFCLFAFLISFGILLVFPPVGIVCLLAVICGNVVSYFMEKGKTEAYLTCFAYIVKLMGAAKKLGSLKKEALDVYTKKLQDDGKRLQGITRGMGLLSCNQMQGDLLETLLDYLRMFTHVDLIKFHQMLGTVQKNMDAVKDMYEVVGLLDTCRSIALYRQSLPLYCKPDFAKEAGVEFTDLYHPLITQPVTNSMARERCVLLTGSNASGKSTFIKTIALNAVFAQTIYTCLANDFAMMPYEVLTSMALRDNLAEQESYYMVEIKSLKRIVDAVHEKRPVLCFIDEVLRGTNTVERIAASSHILKDLKETGAVCFAATHDIELTYILEQDFANYHFREEIIEKQVKFSYQLQRGRATSQNAIRLLSMIGYDAKIVDKSQSMARKFMEEGVWETFGK
jgi:hypothetical protein